MEDSAPKRRKLSPEQNRSESNASATDSSGGSLRRSNRERKRPSFASPTRSSMSRSNPEILERRNAAQSASRDALQDEVRPGSAEGAGDEEDQLTAQLEGASEVDRPQEEEEEAEEGTEPTPTTAASLLKSAVRRISGGMAARPRRTPQKPPRPLPPPSQEEEVLLDPFKGRALRRSPPRGVLPQVSPPAEPELPPTPTEKGMSDPALASTPPSGIHNTPSKRPRRSKALAEKLKSSPLKQPPLRPSELEKGSKGKENARIQPPTAVGKRTGSAQPYGGVQKRQTPSTRKSHPARKVKAIDPLADKKAIRDALLLEVAQLEADLKVTTQENERLYSLQQPGSTDSVPSDPDDTTELLEALRRNVLPPEEEPPAEPSENWHDAALNPISFLPFGKPTVAMGVLELLNPPADAEEKNKELAPPISHHPITMTADEERPFLQAFTPLVFTSTMSLVPESTFERSGPPLERHIISAASQPAGLFAARIEMVVDTKGLTIAELSVPRLESNAISELGPFIEGIVEGKGVHSGMRRNVSVMTWAMSEWTRLASRRARFWCQVATELGTKDLIAESVQKMRKGSRKRKGPGRPPVADEDDDEDGDEDGHKSEVTRTELLKQMGKTELDLELGDGVGLRLQWRIKFDWTGEGQSRIGLLVETPGKWHHHDKRKSLVGVPDVFDKLIRDGKDPMEAVKSVVALLVGEGVE